MAKKAEMDNLCALYEKKLAHLNEIAELTNGQIPLMESDDVQGLMDNIEKRQNCIDAIDQLDTQVAALAETQKKDKTQQAEKAQRLEELKHKIATVLGIIQQQDRANELMATAKLQGYKGIVRQNNDSRKTLDQYGRPPVNTDGTYFDLKK